MSDQPSAQDKWMAHPSIGVQISASAPSQDSAWEAISPAEVQAAVGKAKNKADLGQRLKLPAMWSDEAFDDYLRRKGVDPKKAFASVPYDGPAVGGPRGGISFDEYQKQQAAPLRNIEAIRKDPLAAALSVGAAGDPQAMERQLGLAGAVSGVAGAVAATTNRPSGQPVPRAGEKVGGAAVTGGPNTAAAVPPTNTNPPKPAATTSAPQTPPPPSAASGSGGSGSGQSNRSSGGDSGDGDPHPTDPGQYAKMKAELAAKHLQNADRRGTGKDGVIKNPMQSGSGLKSDAEHRMASFLTEEQQAKAVVTKINDGTLVQVPEQNFNGKAGIVEYIVHKDGTVTHQRFIEGGVIGGGPNQKAEGRM